MDAKQIELSIEDSLKKELSFVEETMLSVRQNILTYQTNGNTDLENFYQGKHNVLNQWSESLRLMLIHLKTLKGK